MAEAPFNGLTCAEAERLALLLEELGEAQKAIGKILRHGYESRNPDSSDPSTNRMLLESELGDVMAAMEIMVDANDVRSISLRIAMERKLVKVHQYFHHQPAKDWTE